jgi:hypothetical protein
MACLSGTVASKISASAPLATDDLTKGFRVGNRWLVPSTSQEYVCMSSAASAAVWTAPAVALQESHVLSDTKTSGTNGGSPVVATWTARDLNTLVSVGNTISVTRAGNAFTLAAGNYTLDASSIFYRVGALKLQLWRTSGTPAAVAAGLSIFSNKGNNTGEVAATLLTSFTLASSATFELQYYAEASQTNGLGQSVGIVGTSEVYTQILITKF